MDSPVVKSAMMKDYLTLFGGPNNLSLLTDERFRFLEHVAHITFDYLKQGLDHLEELKYVSGSCDTSYSEGLNKFCQHHPELEQLHVNFNDLDSPLAMQNWGQRLLELRDWKLPLLKILVYRCRGPSQGYMEHLLEACPNIVQFHVRFLESLSTKIKTIRFLSTIKFQHLTWLTIAARDNLFDGSYLLSVVENSPKLERLHVEGNIEESTFFLNLAQCFPSARYLRDLRIQWPRLQKDLSHFPFFLRALKVCTHFERLVLCVDADDWSLKPLFYTPLQDSILVFVKQMTHLVALCLSGFPIDYTFVGEQLSDQMALEKESRPAFWFHFGPKLPKASDLSIPRIHFDGIVDPRDPYMKLRLASNFHYYATAGLF